MAPSPQPPVAGAEFGRYRIESRLGMGGMGVVYAAEDVRLRRRVALKMISGQLAGDPEFVARFDHEADVLTRLDSPHVIAIFDHGEQDGVPYIATQYIAGGDLGGMLRERGPLTPSTAAAICAQVADALEDAHRAGVVHRDVKSSNVLIRDREAAEPFVYLCDFGIAHTGSRGLTRPGGLAGSWAYLSPERARGEPASRVSDVYSLGCLLCVCLTGHTPYSGTDVEMALAHQHAPVPEFEGDGPLVDRVNDVLSRAMAKRPADRYQSAAAFRADLLELARSEEDAVLAARPIGSPRGQAEHTATAVRPPRRRIGRRLPLAVAGAAAVVAAASLGPVVVGLGGDGDGGELPTEPEPTSESGPAIAGDFDADGFGDVLLRWYDGRGSGGVRNYLLRSDGQALAAPVRVPSRDGLAVVGNVDGDGPADLVFFDGLIGNDRTGVRTIHADGSNDYVRWPPTDDRTGAYPLLADVDGVDGDDLVLFADTGTDTGADIEVALSTPEGFGEPARWHRTGQWNQFYDSMYAGDVDGDGRDDLVPNVRIPAPRGEIRVELRLLLSRGERFEPGPSRRVLRVAGDQNPIATVGDVDGDGAAEVVAYLPGPRRQEIRVYDVTGTRLDEGTVWGRDDEPSDLDSRTQILLSDVDGDADDDLVLVRPRRGGDYRIEVARSDGTSFEAAQTWAEVPCFVSRCKETIFPLTGSL